jgi:hypothetical protein
MARNEQQQLNDLLERRTLRQVDPELLPELLR